MTKIEYSTDGVHWQPLTEYTGMVQNQKYLFHIPNTEPTMPHNEEIKNMSDEEAIEPIEPIGNFIFKQFDVKHFMANDGAYYHYSDVCTLLNRMRSQQQQKDELLKETMQILSVIEPHQPFEEIKILLTRYNNLSK